MNEKEDKNIFNVMTIRDINQKGVEKAHSRIMRFLAFPIVSVLVHTPITANQVTTFGILSNLIAVLCFASQNYLFGVMFLFIGHILDYADGSIARYKNQVSVLTSNFLSRFYHDGSSAFIFTGIGIGLFQEYNNILYLFFGMFTTILQQTTMYFLEMKNRLLLTYTGIGRIKKINSSFIKKEKVLINLFVLPVDFEIIILVIFFSTIINKLDVMLLFYTAYFFLRCVVFFIGTYYKLKKTEANLR